MRPVVIFLCFLIAGLSACKAKYDLFKTEGDLAEITFKDESVEKGELILLREDSVLYRRADGFVTVSLDHIDRIKILEPYLHPTALPVKYSIAGVSTLGGGILFTQGGDAPIGGAILLGIGAANWYAAFSQRNRYRFRPPLSERKRSKLLLHCRFPQGLTPEQRQQLIPSEIKY